MRSTRASTGGLPWSRDARRGTARSRARSRGPRSSSKATATFGGAWSATSTAFSRRCCGWPSARRRPAAASRRPDRSLRATGPSSWRGPSRKPGRLRSPPKPSRVSKAHAGRWLRRGVRGASAPSSNGERLRPSRRRSHQLAQRSGVWYVGASEREGVAVPAHPDQDRDDLDRPPAVGRREDDLRDGVGIERRAEPCLHACHAHLAQAPLVLPAVVLVDSRRDRQPRARRMAPVGTRLALREAAHRVRLEEGQDLVQAVQLDRLAHEVGRGQLQTLSRLAFVDDSRDRDDRNAEVPDGTELEEVESAHSGKLDIEEDRVRSLGQELGERGLGGVNDDGLMAELEKKIAKDIAEVDLILDNQYPHRRQSSTIGAEPPPTRQDARACDVHAILGTRSNAKEEYLVGLSARDHLCRADRRLRRRVARGGASPASQPPRRGQAHELRVRRRADRVGLGAVSHRVLPRRARVHRLRCARGVPVPVGAGPPERRTERVLGDGHVRGHPRAWLALRLPGRRARMEVKPPIPQIPPPVWREFKDLQEWEKYHQARPQDDKTSNALASIADAIHHMPGGWIVTTSTEKIFNWARKSSIWPVTFGLACCAIEMMATFASRFDVERFGMGPWASPRHSDLMIVSGTVTIKMAPMLK